MISIAMATYNGARFIREQLDSILAQTITDWELVVCDDGSSDETVSILQEYIAKDSRIKLHKNPQNLGFKRNFEQSIILCKGDYIALCDQDDIWYPTHLEILYNQIGEHSLSIGNSDIVDINNQYLNKRMSDTDGIYFIPNDTSKLIYREIFHSNPFQGAAMLLESRFAKSCLPIPKVVKYHDAWISACACLADGLVYTYTPVIRYRHHGANITTEDNQREHGKTTIQKYKSNIKKSINTLLKKEKLTTDRFAMVERLKEIYGTKNSDFAKICDFINNAEKQKLSWTNIILLWKNIEYITTSQSKRSFINYWFIWSHIYPKTEI